jgi:hypothetical protein
MSSQSIVLAQLYEHVSRRGKRYFVGRIGAAKVLLVETGNVDRGSPVWQLNLDQGPRTTKEQVGLAREIAAEGGGDAQFSPPPRT